MIPPTTAVRVLLHFRDGNYTWSESYWTAGTNAEDPTPDDQAALTKATRDGGLCDKRVQLLGAGAQLLRVMASRDNVFRDSLLKTKYSQWAAPAGALPSVQIYNRLYCGLIPLIDGCEPAAEPQVVLRVRMQTGARRRRTLFLGGIPQALDQPGANVPFPAVSDPFNRNIAGYWNTAFDAFVAVLLADSWGYVGVGYTTEVPIDTITSDVVAQTVTVKLTAGSGISKKDTVLIFHPRYNAGSYNFHGVKEVFDTVGLDTFIFKVKNVGPISYDSGGVMRGPAFRSLFVFTDIIGAFVAAHERGNAELAIRGRSRNRHNYVG